VLKIKTDWIFLISVAKIHEGQLSLFVDDRPPLILQQQACARYLYDQLLSVYQRLKFTGLDDQVFADLVIARLIEPTSKLDTIRVLLNLD